MTIEENYQVEMALLLIQIRTFFEVLTPEQKEEYNRKIQAEYEIHLTEITKYVPSEDVYGYWIPIRSL